jgi:hypothetical protein
MQHAAIKCFALESTKREGKEGGHVGDVDLLRKVHTEDKNYSPFDF